MPKLGAALMAWCLLGCADLGLTKDTASPLAEDELNAPETKPISFWKDLAPMFVGKCTLCHHADNPTGVDLTRPFDKEIGIIGRKTAWREAAQEFIVDPGDPDNSFLVEKVSGRQLDTATEGAPMPLMFSSLSSSEIGTIREWISDGARDTDFFRDEVAPIFGDGKSLRSAGRCSLCHYTGGGVPDLVDPFSKSGVVGLVNSRGDVLVDPGNPDGSLLVQKIEGRVTAGLAMPLALEPFSPHEVKLIERWIREGAREN